MDYKMVLKAVIMIDRKRFYKKVRELKLFDKLSLDQVNSIECIFDEWEKTGNEDYRQLAYLFGTVYHETGRKMLPVDEIGSDKYLRSKPYYPYYGRGYIQLTWLTNYKKFSKLLGLDLVAVPNLVKYPHNAAKIAVYGMQNGTFTGVGLSKYFNKEKCDWVNARRIINGKDKAVEIAGYAKLFNQAL